MTPRSDNAQPAAQAKSALRSQMRALRRSLAADWLRTASAQVCSRLLALPELQAAHAVALYWPMPGEADVQALRGELDARGASVFLPCMTQAGELGFRQLRPGQQPVCLGNAFLEAPPGPCVVPGELEVILVPALGVDRLGYRLGMGSGFYDRLLPRFRPKAASVAVVFSSQVLEAVPRAPHDARCDIVVTEEETLRPS